MRHSILIAICLTVYAMVVAQFEQHMKVLSTKYNVDVQAESLEWSGGVYQNPDEEQDFNAATTEIGYDESYLYVFLNEIIDMETTPVLRDVLIIEKNDDEILTVIVCDDNDERRMDVFGLRSEEGGKFIKTWQIDRNDWTIIPASDEFGICTWCNSQTTSRSKN